MHGAPWGHGSGKAAWETRPSCADTRWPLALGSGPFRRVKNMAGLCGFVTSQKMALEYGGSRNKKAGRASPRSLLAGPRTPGDSAFSLFCACPSATMKTCAGIDSGATKELGQVGEFASIEPMKNEDLGLRCFL